jgi:hypothetical protein
VFGLARPVKPWQVRPHAKVMTKPGPVTAALAIAVSDPHADDSGLCRFCPLEVAVQRVHESANGHAGCKEFQLPEQREARNLESAAKATKRRIESHADTSGRQCSDISDSDKQHIVLDFEVDDDDGTIAGLGPGLVTGHVHDGAM